MGIPLTGRYSNQIIDTAWISYRARASVSAAAAVSIEKLKISVRVELPFWADPPPALAEPTLESVLLITRKLSLAGSRG